MSAIQIVCAVAVPLLWGYQFVAIKVGVTEFPPLFFLALRFLAIALLLIPFVKRPTRQQVGPIAAISVFLGGLNFGLFYVGLGLGSGSMSAVAYQLATPFTVLLAWPLLAERPSLTTSPEWCLHSSAWSCWQRGLACRQTHFRCCLWSGQPSHSRCPTS